MDAVSISISLLFKAPTLIKAVGELIGLIESVDEKISKLLESDFNAGVRCLRELTVSTREQEFILREGWNRFHTALTHEDGVRKALSYVGLSLCQYNLGEKVIAINTLRELTQFKYINFTIQKMLLIYPLLASFLFIDNAFEYFRNPDSIPDPKYREAFKKLRFSPEEQIIMTLQKSANDFIQLEMAKQS